MCNDIVNENHEWFGNEKTKHSEKKKRKKTQKQNKKRANNSKTYTYFLCQGTDHYIEIVPFFQYIYVTAVTSNTRPNALKTLRYSCVLVDVNQRKAVEIVFEFWEHFKATERRN